MRETQGHDSDLDDFREVPERQSFGEEEGEVEESEEMVAASQELKYAVARIAHAQGQKGAVSISKQLVGCIHELALDFCETLQSDMEQFAKHAKRTTVGIDDVRLCARRNPKLLQLLDDFARAHLKPPNKRRKTDATKA
eukprot:3571804-Rhodomonas_salina.1